MAALESSSLAVSFFRLPFSSNPPLLSPSTARSKLSFPISTTKLSHKSYPHLLPISTKFRVLSSSAIQEEVAVEEEEQSEKPQEEILQKRLFVLNLPWTYSVDELKNLFSECGTVEDAEIIKRKKDGKSRGYAFVTMASRQEALSVIEKYDSYELMGRIIRVEFAKDNKKTSPAAPPPGGDRCKLYVSNLAWKVRANDLRDFFATECNPISTRVVFDVPEGRSAGYGFVTFASKQEAESAISAFDGKELLGRPVIVKFSERGADKSEAEQEGTSNEQPQPESESETETEPEPEP
ncbi:28 kDa ribonucleoprotein, chloroplastic-like [Cynara cardunculus var. scolymus]|uniref:28 kDa ribonucleoprotein, chloroplastic-like n=1 Tax=Cynara cardunculus var. scolymus TaxID=59895 RepID=UPI000D626BF6|nr:28 kDa ribonucleoprotein, chloroplastic-like [Cynara cardunculus var. scolymus]